MPEPDQARTALVGSASPGRSRQTWAAKVKAPPGMVPPTVRKPARAAATAPLSTAMAWVREPAPLSTAMASVRRPAAQSTAMAWVQEQAIAKVVLAGKQVEPKATRPPAVTTVRPPVGRATARAPAAGWPPGEQATTKARGAADWRRRIHGLECRWWRSPAPVARTSALAPQQQRPRAKARRQPGRPCTPKRAFQRIPSRPS